MYLLALIKARQILQRHMILPKRLQCTGLKHVTKIPSKSSNQLAAAAEINPVTKKSDTFTTHSQFQSTIQGPRDTYINLFQIVGHNLVGWYHPRLCRADPNEYYTFQCCPAVYHSARYLDAPSLFHGAKFTPF